MGWKSAKPARAHRLSLILFSPPSLSHPLWPPGGAGHQAIQPAASPGGGGQVEGGAAQDPAGTGPLHHPGLPLPGLHALGKIQVTYTER